MNREEKIQHYYSIYGNRVGKKNLTPEEFQPLVLNIAYLEIAEAKRSGTRYDTAEVFTGYTLAACKVVPGYLKEANDPNYKAMYFGFAATAEWDGLWTFLRDYFDNNLGVKIDNVQMKYLRFDSSSHSRFEAGEHISTSEIERKVTVAHSEDMRNAQFEISFSLSNKEAILLERKGNEFIYIGTDPDFRFEFSLDFFGNIEKFVLLRTDRDLRIEYYE
jgi:hypothetical protein